MAPASAMAIKDRRRGQRISMTGMEAWLRQGVAVGTAGSLNSNLPWDFPWMNRAGVDGAAFWKYFWKGHHREAIRHPRSPRRGTAQDRKRQEP